MLVYLFTVHGDVTHTITLCLIDSSLEMPTVIKTKIKGGKRNTKQEPDSDEADSGTEDGSTPARDLSTKELNSDATVVEGSQEPTTGVHESTVSGEGAAI